MVGGGGGGGVYIKMVGVKKCFCLKNGRSVGKKKFV
jgi:hypothetical protein